MVKMLQTTQPLGGTIQANGAEIYHEVRGAGPPLLFIPGATGDAGGFAQVAARLADEFTAVTYDRRGNSRSPRPAGWHAPPANKQGANEQGANEQGANEQGANEHAVDEQADDAALLRVLGLAPALVYGNSSGAIIALNLLIRHPEVVAGAVLHEPPLLSVLARPEDATGQLRPRVAQALAEGGPRRALEIFLRTVIGDAAFEQIEEPMRTRMLGNGETFFGHEFGRFEFYRPDDATLAAVTRPVQVMAGAESLPFFREAAAWLAARLGVAVTPLPGGHSPQRDRPQAVADTIRPFLRRASRA